MGLKDCIIFVSAICQQKINKKTNLWLPGATDISKYPKLSKVTDFRSSQNDLFSGFFFRIFFWLNAVKCSLNETLNSCRKEKLSTRMKLNQKHCILIWKLTLKIHFFPGLVTSSKLAPWLYFTFFDFALRDVPFQQQNVTEIVHLWTKLW